MVLSRLKNIETTNEGKYFNGRGAELFAQWEFRDKWWLTGGGNYLVPDDDEPDAGEYEILYMVLGFRSLHIRVFQPNVLRGVAQRPR